MNTHLLFSHFLEYDISIIKNVHRFTASSDFSQNRMLIALLHRFHENCCGFRGVKIQVLKCHCSKEQALIVLSRLKAILQVALLFLLWIWKCTCGDVYYVLFVQFSVVFPRPKSPLLRESQIKHEISHPTRLRRNVCFFILFTFKFTCATGFNF